MKRIFLIALTPLLFVSCSTYRKWMRSIPCDNKVETTESKQVSALVEQLASPVGPSGKEFWADEGMRIPKSFADSEHPQVARARAKLVSMGPAIFPDLVKHLKDERYSYTASSACTMDYSVGNNVKRIMEEVVCGRFYRARVRPSCYKSRESPLGSSMQPSFGRMMGEFGVEAYAERVKGMTRDEVEREYVQWHLQKEKSYGFVDAKQEREIVTPCLKRLSELRRTMPRKQQAAKH